MGIEQLNQVLKAFLKQEVKARGQAKIAWQYKGRRPGDNDLKALFKEEGALAQRLRGVSFVDQAELSLLLQGLDLDLPLDAKSAVKVLEINTPVPLSLSLRKGLKDVKIQGQVVFGKIQELPGSR